MQQSISARLTFNCASEPIEVSKVTYTGRVQCVLKCFAGPETIAVNTTSSLAWEPYRTQGHMPASGEYHSLVYLSICMWKVKTILAVLLHCLGHPEHHSDMSCLDFRAGRKGAQCLSVSVRRKNALWQLLCFQKIMPEVKSGIISVIIHQALMV